MLVYGDHDRNVVTRDYVAELHNKAARLAQEPPGLAWHAACVSLFIDLAALLQGVADAEFAGRGLDEASPAQGALMAVLVAAAQAVDRSWSSGFSRQQAPDLVGLQGAALPQTLHLRRCEGYAYYALYPELYLEAARALPAVSAVIGLRSIGTGLAALVASVCGAPAYTLRPFGEPFSRTVKVGPALSASITTHPHGAIVLVDEGPGLSGSSLGGAADWLEGLGVARERIVFMPSHGSDLGPHASPVHRERWSASTRLVTSLEEVIVAGQGGVPMASWFADLTGEPTVPLLDLSGGAWRALSPYPDAPADPGREARKFLLTTRNGRFLLKFAGIDDAGRAKFARARRLYEAGFSPEPLAWRYGFLIERWVEAEPLAVPASDMAAHLGRYLSFRNAAFADAQPGASLVELVEMARYNIGEATGRPSDPLFVRWTPERLAQLQPLVRPVHIDGRLHRWEWLQTPAGVLKTDGVDHSQAHDLVGCEDIAWDVAGAAVEFDLSPPQCDALTAAVMPGRTCAAELVELMTLCYLGFQIGWWTMAQDSEANRRQRDRYLSKVAHLAHIAACRNLR